MRRTICFVLLVAILTVFACKNQNQPHTPPPAVETSKSEPDNNDLLQALQGKWESETDSTYVLEIVDNKMRHMNHGQLRLESEIVVDGACSDTTCAGGENVDGWCFLEKRQRETECHLVLKCDPNELKYAAKTSDEQQLSFKKVK